MGAISCRYKSSLVLLLLIFFVGISLAERSCKNGCSKSETGFLKYAPGNVYEYNYDSIMTVVIGKTSSGENDDTSVKISGNAKIFSKGNCGYVLQLNAVRVTALKEETIEKRIQQSITKPVYFTLIDGYIEPEICVENNDDIFSLNIKRAIISLLQTSNEAENKIEVDVFGQCPTHTATSTPTTSNSLVVTKMRNLNNCAYRELIVSGLVNGVVNEKSGIKSSMLMKADYAKEVKIENGIINDIRLVEDYNFIGGLKENSDIRAKVVTNMKMKNTASAQAPSSGDKAVDIIFQKPDVYNAKNLPVLKAVITELVQTNTDYMHKDSAKHFGELIRLMRNSDSDTLLELASVPFSNKVLGRKIYLDALFRTGTAESARAIMKQFAKFNDLEKSISMLSLNLVQVVDKETINQATTLLSPTAIKETFLAVGNLLRRYCQQQDCENAPEVQGITKKFVDGLKRCKANTKKDEERIIHVLKGIANAESGLSKQIVPALTECASPGHSLRIRVSAVQAFSVASCENDIRVNALNLLKDQNEDSELRIEAYLSAVECPTAELANEIAQIVENEKVQQVGGFMASHLRSIRDSTDAHRERLRHFFGNIRISQHFPTDIRRFSYNNELSYRLDALGVSASADYKLIYSQNGFLPRSARLNVTSEIFGMNFNVMEASVRQENLESILEYYFGPKGLLNKDFDEIMKVSGTAGVGRSRRSIADESMKFAKKYKNYGSNIKNADDLNLDLSLKLFGSEMMFLSLGDNIPRTLDDIIRTFSIGFDEFKGEISNFQKEFTMHTMFLDTEFLYPTGIGMPFEISAQGLAANKFDVKVSVDIDAIIEQNWQRSKYNLKIVPSVDLNVNFRAGFNAYVLSTGLQASSSLHSASGADVTLAFINDNGFSMDVQLPRDKLELVNAQSIVEFYVGEQDKQLKTILPKGSKELQSSAGNSEMCFDQLQSIGLTFCFYSSLSEKDSLSNGLHPRSAGLYLKSERNFHIEGYHESQTPSGTKKWRLNFSTPGSQESHDTAVAVEIGLKPRAFGRITLDYPNNHFAIEAGVNNDDKEFVAYSQYEQNNHLTKNRIGFEKHGNEYRPIINIQGKDGTTINEINGYHADGRVVVQKIDEKLVRYNFENFKIINKQNENQRLVLNGWTDVGQSNLQTEMNVQHGTEAFVIKGLYKLENGIYEVGTFVSNQKTPENVMGASIHLHITEGKIDVNVLGKGNRWEVSTKSNVEYAKGTNFNTITSSKFQGELSVKHKEKMVASIALNGFTENQNKFGVDIKLSHGKQTGSLSTKFQANQNAKNDYALELNVKLNRHFVDLMAKCDVINNQYSIDNVLTSSWGTAFTAKGHLGQRYTPQDILIDLYGSAQLSSKDKPSQWMLKVNGSPEKTVSELKITRDNQDLIKYNGETVHPQDKVVSGKANVNIKDTLNTKIDFKIAKNGKGELNAYFETLRTDAKHKAELTSKFHIQSPKYDIETSIIVDNDKKLYFNSENNIEKSKMSSKNIVEIVENKFNLDMNIQMKGADWRTNGEVGGSFTFKLPTEHIFQGSIARKITTNPKSGQMQGFMDLELNEQHKGKKRQLNWNAKLEKLNIKTKDISMDTKISFTNTENKKVNLDYNIKHIPIGNGKYKIDFKINISGNGLHFNPSQLTLYVSEYDERHASGALNANYGSDNQINVNGNYKIGARNTPSTYDVHAELKIPQSEFKFFDISSNGKYLKPENNDGNGIHLLEMQIDEKNGNGQFIKLHTSYSGSRNQGTYGFHVQTDKMNNPIKIDGSYQRERSTNTNDDANFKNIFSTGVTYGDKYLKTSGDINRNDREFTLHYILKSNFESIKTIDVTVQSEHLDTDSQNLKAQIKLNDQVYAITSLFNRSTHKKGVELDIVTPQSSEHIILNAMFEVLGEHKGKLVGQISNLAGLDLKITTEADFKDVDSFYIIGSWNSERLHLNNYMIEFKTQDKSIVLSLKNAEGIIMSGNAAYVLKKDGNKSYIEGQGQVQYKGKPYNTNFKLIRQIYDATSDKEMGFSYTFNGNFGPINGVSTLKITNKDFNVKLSVCEEKKQCNNVQIQSLISVADGSDTAVPFESTQHSLLVLVDFRELGYPYEFELQSKAIRQGFKIQYSLDSNIISNNNLKYQLVVNIVPKSSKIQIRLPSREIQLETTTEYPKSGLFGKYMHLIEFHFDKVRKSNEVTRLESTIDITGNDDGLAALNTKGQIRFEHPNIRPLIISGQVDLNRDQQIFNAEVNLDVFKKPEQQITIMSRIQNSKQQNGFNISTNQQIRSSALGLHFEINGHSAYDIERHELSVGGDLQTGSADMNGNFLLFANQNHLVLNLLTLNERIIHITSDFNRKNYNSKLNTKLQLFSQKPFELSAEIEPSFAKVEFKQEGLSYGNIEHKLGKELTLHAENAGNLLVDAKILLESSNFLETTYTANEENWKKFTELIETEIEKDTKLRYEQAKQRLQKLREYVEQQVDLSKESLQDLSKLADSYHRNLQEIISELEQDPTLKDIIKLHREFYEKITKFAENLTNTLTEAYKQIQKSLTSIYAQLKIILNDTIIPLWEEFLLALTKTIGSIRIAAAKMFTETIKTVAAISEKYLPVIKNYGKAIYEILKPYNESIQGLYKTLADVIEEIYEEINVWISQLPSLDAIRVDLKDKITNLKLPERLLELLNLLFEQIQILPTTPETHDLLERLHNYLEAKIKGQNVSDNEVVDELLKLFVKALRSIWVAIEISLPITPNTFGGSSISSSSGIRDMFTILPNYFYNLNNLWPGILTFKFSILNFIINEDWTSIFNHDNIKSLIYFHDFNLHGHIADGHHIFTYDGKYFAFHGNCKYILAQDSVDKNFTVIAQLNNGKLKALILSDRNGDYLEVNDAGSLKYNGNSVEYPLHDSGNMHAWRKYYTIWLLSEYGAEVMCTSDLKVCHINVNGFYTGKMRGLLGNGNAEIYDDFIQVDGTISNESGNFGSNYGLGKCNPVTEESQAESPQSEICNDIFSFESPLAYWFYVKDFRPYKLACNHAVQEASDKEKEIAACNIALAYGSALAMQFKYSMLPSRCLKCPGAAGQRDLYQEFTVKIPNNKADIVFVVDTDIKPIVMSKLVAPAITEIRESLKARGFTDVQIGVIAYNESQKYPALLTSDNGKLNYNGNLAEVKLNGPNNFCDGCLSQIITEKYVLEIYDVFERILKGIIPQSDELALEFALNYPFRAGAAKSFIDVRSDSLKYSGNMLKWIRAHIAEAVTKFDGAVLHLLSPVKGMNLEGVPAEKLLGFNSRLVATLDGKDAKKRQKLLFETDMGIDFVLNSGGWVFSTENFENLKPNDQKKALNQITNSIADTLFKTEIVSDCKCLPLHGLHAQHVCVVKSSNFIPNKKIKA